MTLAIPTVRNRLVLVHFDAAGVQRMIDALRLGEVVVLPPPSPITYGLAGIDPAALNTAKGRPPGQPVAVGLTGLRTVVNHMGLTAARVDLVEWLLFSEALTVLAPVKEPVPNWLAPATMGGSMLLAGAWLTDTLPIVESVDHLYLSSGNRTGREPSSTAAEADAEFNGQLLVLDADALRTPGHRHGATAMVQVRESGLTLARHGINDQAFDQSDPGPYLKDLEQRFTAL